MGTRLTDSEPTRRLLQRIRDGDEAAREELFDRHRDQIRRTIELRMAPRLRQRLDVSDMIQVTQLEAFRYLADYLRRRPMPFRLWLRKTAQRRMWDAWRRHTAAKRTGRAELALPEDSSVQLAGRLVDPGESPSEHADKAEQIQRVNRAMGRLPEADREILLMRVYEGLSNQEVAAVLGMNKEAASKRHARALVRLQKLVEAESGDPA